MPGAGADAAVGRRRLHGQPARPQGRGRPCRHRRRRVLLPPYSPDLIPIENAFAKFKAILRKAAARTFDELISAIRDALPAFSPGECTNYFTACGYERRRPAGRYYYYEAGGPAVDTVVATGGCQDLGDGGVASGTVVQGGGLLSAYNATVSNAVVSSGSMLSSYGGTLVGTTVQSGGSEDLEGSATGSGLLAGNSTSVTNNGTLVYAEPVGSNVVFGGTLVGSGTVVQDSPGTPVPAEAESGLTGAVTVSAGVAGRAGRRLAAR